MDPSRQPSGTTEIFPPTVQTTRSGDRVPPSYALPTPASETFRIPQSACRILFLLFFALRVPQSGQDS